MSPTDDAETHGFFSEKETIYVIIVTHFYYGNIGQLKLWIVE